MQTKADCCPRPSLRIMEAMPDESDAKVSVQRCENCQTYWQVVVDQVITDSGEVYKWDWYHPLTEEDAESVLACLSPR